MSNIGVFASKFSISSKSLKDFDEALKYLKIRKKISRTKENIPKINNLLKVIKPITESINGRFSESLIINETNVVTNIKKRHESQWPTYKEKILKLYDKLNSGHFQLTERDIEILNDIADALDSECANLFYRISERK